MPDEPSVAYANPSPIFGAGSRGYAEALGRLMARWRLIVLLSCAGAALAYGAGLLIPPSYIATTTIFVDSRSLQPLASQSSQPQGDNNAEVSFVESQAKIITSQSVLSRVVEAEGLADNPDFNGTASSPMETLLHLLGSGPGEATSPDIRARTALMALSERVAVRRPERTFVVDVSVRGKTADQAARLANAVAQAYFDEQASAHADMARRASLLLTGRLDELRQRVQQSEGRAQSFRDQHGLIGTRSQLSSEQQLVEANAQLAQARIHRIQSRARLDDTTGPAGAGHLEADTPEATASPTVTLLRGQQAEAKRRLDSALAQFGRRHPAVRDAEDQLAGLNRSVGVELRRIKQAAQIEYQRATAAEAAQKELVDRLSAEAVGTSGALAQATQLDQEVEVNKNLLNVFLSRARETGEMGQLETSTARVISAAQPPFHRASPPRGIVFIGLGAIAGFWIAAAIILIGGSAMGSLVGRGLRPLDHPAEREPAYAASTPRDLRKLGVQRTGT